MVSDRVTDDERCRFFALSLDMLTVIDADGRFREVNPAWTHTLGWSRDELLGRDFPELVHPDDAERTRDEMARMAAEGVDGRVFENRCRHRDGSYRILVWSGRHDHATGRRYAVARDVTEVQRREREQRALAESARSAAVREEHQAFQQRLINAVAHELHTPLTPMLLQARVVAEHVDAQADQRLGRAVASLERNLARIARSVRDVIAVARAGSGPLLVRLVPVDLRTLVEQEVQDHWPAAASRGIGLGCDVREALPVLGDPDHVRQALGHLLENAIKFSSGGDHVQVVAERTGPMAEISVLDEGPGIPEGERERVFRPFVQVHDNMQRTDPGVGLGLYLAKAILDAHGGTIGVVAGEGGGSRFWFRLPLREAEGPGRTAWPPSASESSAAEAS